MRRFGRKGREGVRRTGHPTAAERAAGDGQGAEPRRSAPVRRKPGGPPRHTRLGGRRAGAPVGGPRPSVRPRRVLLAALAAGALLLAAVLGGVSALLLVGAGGKSAAGENAGSVGYSQLPGGGGTANLVPRIVAKVRTSVVQVDTSALGGRTTGSGLVLTTSGVVLTNFHVISPALRARRIVVKFSNSLSGRSAQATLIGADPKSDLALLKVPPLAGLEPAPLGDSDTLQVGETVLAIGSPAGFQGTVTAGIVSAVDRRLTVAGPNAGVVSRGAPVTYAAVQTDAPMGPGNSGGPLIDLHGRVVGINSAVYAPPRGVPENGLGFAIPINQVRQTIQKLGVPTSR